MEGHQRDNKRCARMNTTPPSQPAHVNESRIALRQFGLSVCSSAHGVVRSGQVMLEYLILFAVVAVVTIRGVALFDSQARAVVSDVYQSATASFNSTREISVQATSIGGSSSQAVPSPAVPGFTCTSCESSSSGE